MKTYTTIGIMAAALLVAGCCTTHPIGQAYGHEREFRKLLEASLPPRDKIESIHFSYDFEKALVIYQVPAVDGCREAIFEDDGFGRYRGQMSCVVQVGATGHSGVASKPIVITLPN